MINGLLLFNFFMDKFIVTISGLTLISAIYWFFFGKKDEPLAVSDTFTITVDGGYKPKIIRIPKNMPVTLTFIRKDSNPCLEEIVFPDYKIKKFLPLNQNVIIELSPPHPVKSGFHCGMNMFHGKIIVE